SNDGDPIASSGVFFINRSSPKKPAPIRIAISNVRVIVPQTVSMYGIAVAGHDVTLDHVQIEGYPRDDVLIGGRANGNGYTGNVAVLNSTLGGAKRNAISAFGVINLRVEGNTIEGVRDSPPGQPAAGIDVEPDDRGQPTLGVRILHNMFEDNAGPGILFELESNSGDAMLASDLEVRDNTVVRNALAHTPPKRAGIIVAGGEDGGRGTLALTGNVVHDNGGPGILVLRLELVVQASGNDVAGNKDDTGQSRSHGKRDGAGDEAPAGRARAAAGGRRPGRACGGSDRRAAHAARRHGNELARSAPGRLLPAGGRSRGVGAAGGGRGDGRPASR